MALKKYNGENIRLSTASVVAIDAKSLIYGSKTIIDGILLWCDVKAFILLYFRCVCEVFKQYRVSFRLDKCEFLKHRVEYVGHDILRH